MQIWLYEDVSNRIEGYIIGKRLERTIHKGSYTISGFDEYMNIVIDEAEEVQMKTQKHKKLGRILLKGDNITLIQTVQ